MANFYGTNGLAPNGELIQRTDGLLYGTTLEGGDFGQGTIFKTTLDGSLKTLYSFDGTNGAYPSFSPLVAPDGNSYGMATYGGNGFNGTGTGLGTIFKWSSDGSYSNLFLFGGTNGANPSSLIFGNDGNLYGTTFYGGAFTNDPVSSGLGDGTAFEITTNGDFTLLASFDGTNGAIPYTLIQAKDGNFYGVTDRGGSNGLGSVFQMTPGGVVTNLFSFNGTNGAGPTTLIQGSDRSLYGNTLFGGPGFDGTGPSGDGTVFQITTNGNLTPLASLNRTITGSQPQGRLLEVSNGVFYGTASRGGSNQYAPEGTLFQVKTNGGLTVLVNFIDSLELPSMPASGLIQATDGNYYGVGNDGVYAIRPIQPTVIQAAAQGGQINITWNAWAGYRYMLFSQTNVTLPLANFTNPPLSWNELLQTIPSTNGVMSFSDTIGPDPQLFYQVLFQQVY